MCARYAERAGSLGLARPPLRHHNDGRNVGEERGAGREGLRHGSDAAGEIALK